MSKKLARVLAVVLAAALVITLVGCSGNTSTNTTAATTAAATTAAGTTAAATTAAATTAADTTAATTAPASADAVHIRWVGAEYGAVDEDAPIKLAVEERFNVDFELIYIESTTYAEQMGLLFASDDVPDAFHARSVTIYNEWVNQEMLAQFTLDQVKEYAPNVYEEIAHWSGKVNFDLWDAVRINGDIYGLPQLNTDGTFAAPIVYRDDWMANVGVEKEPETIAEWTDLFYAFANDDPDGNGTNDTYALSKSGMKPFWGLSGYCDATWSLLPDGTIGYGNVQPEMKEVLAMFAKWYADGVLDPEYITGENTGGYWALSHSFLNGRIGMTSHGSYYHWNYPYYEGNAGGANYQPFVELNPEGSYTIAKQVPKTEDGVGSMPTGLGTTGSQFVMGYQVEDNLDVMAKIFEILDAGVSDYDFYLMVKNGIEGVHWEFDENGVVVQTESWKKESETYDSSLAASSAIGSSNCFCPWQSMINYQRLQKYQYDFANATVANYTGNISIKQLTMPSEAEYITDLNTLISTMTSDIITGVQPVDYFDEAVAQWYAQGGQTLTDEVNEYYGG